MATYGQFCAVARALEVLGERWTLLVVRELAMGPARFNEIRRGLPRIPRATLASRLRALQRADVVVVEDGVYRLTDAGQALTPLLAELAGWARVWDRRGLTPDHLDTEALAWDIQRGVDHEALPDRTVVVEVELVDRPPHDRRFWLHLARSHVELCRSDTGDPVDLALRAPAEPVARWWLGELAWRDVARRPDVTLEGPTALRRAFPTWFRGYALSASAARRRDPTPVPSQRRGGGR